MKKILSLLLIAALSISSVTLLSSCSAKASEGLEFKSNGNGTCDWTGLGTCQDTEIVVPEKNGEETVVSVAKEVLGRKKGITKVTLPDTVKTLQENALAYNDDLVEIDFGKGLESIGDNAVGYCEKLKIATLPSGLKSIGRSAFTSDTSLTEIVIPEGIEDIDSHAFAYTDGVKKITIPASMNEFNMSDFSSKSLEEINFKGEYKYFYLSKSDSDGYYGAVCQDNKKSDLSNLYDEITEKSYNSIICLILNKQSIKLNGKEIKLSTDAATGKYIQQNNMYQFEIAENNEVIISYGVRELAEIARLEYQIDNSSGAFVVKGNGTNNGNSIDISGKILPLGDKIFVDMTLGSRDTVSGVYSIN